MTQIRSAKLPADLVEMLAAIARHNANGTVAEIADPILRRPVERLFKKLPQADRDYALARIARMTGEPIAPAS